MRSRLVSMTLVLFIAISLLAIVTVFIYKYIIAPDQPLLGTQVVIDAPSMEQAAELSVPTKEIMTSLADNRIVMIEFTLIANSKKAKQELEKGMVLIKGEIVGLLSSLNVDDLKSEEGLNAVEARLVDRINTLMKNGKVVKVVTTKKVFN